MIIVSSLLEYGNKILRWPQEAKNRSNDIENGQERRAAYELVDDAHDPRPTVIPSSCGNTVPVHGDTTDDVRTETRSSTPQTGGAEDSEGSNETLNKSERRRNHKYKVLFGLALPFALQSLDTTIIASALPFIASDFGVLTWCSANTITISNG